MSVSSQPAAKKQKLPYGLPSTSTVLVHHLHTSSEKDRTKLNGRRCMLVVLHIVALVMVVEKQ